MANYRETQVSGDSWIRAKRIILENPLNSPPQAHFIEERVIVAGTELADMSTDGYIKINVLGTPLNDTMTDPTTSFNLLNPETDEVIGTATYSDIYAIMYSLHRHLAAIRDAQNN